MTSVGLILLVLGTFSPGVGRGADVAVSTDCTERHQTWFGFGGTEQTGFAAGVDLLTPSQRNQVVDMLFNQVKLNTGYHDMGAESSAATSDPWLNKANDNEEPDTADLNGFNFSYHTHWKQSVYDLAPPGSREDKYPCLKVNSRWWSPWLDAIKESNYELWLDEIAEQVAVKLAHWTDTMGSEPEYVHLFNEPIVGGNQELRGATAQELTDIIKRVGARIRAAGYKRAKFVVPSSETEEDSYRHAQVMLADPEARQYIGAIGYHTYPYDSRYSNVAHILDESGQGEPNSEAVAIRTALKELASSHGLPLWMTEVSNPFKEYGGGYDTSRYSFDALHGRAIHIHDEMVHADAAMYCGMNSFYASNMRGGIPSGASDDIVNIDTVGDQVWITPTGRAIGHYARWIRKGAIRVGSDTSDSRLQVTSFQDAIQGRLVWVLINNHEESRRVDVSLRGATLSGPLTGEQSTVNDVWLPLAAFAPNNPAGYSIVLPARSVTTVSGAQSRDHPPHYQ